MEYGMNMGIDMEREINRKTFIKSLEGKHVGVIGLGIAGHGALQALKALGVTAYVLDQNVPDSLPYGKYVSLEEADGIDFELAIISPGVPLDSAEAQFFVNKGVKIIGELEFAYKISMTEFVAVTGTNGKTTTTSLLGQIFSMYTNSQVVGNIGVSASAHALSGRAVFVAEVSSFQMETVEDFKTEISAILNITPDHLNRHQTFDVYRDLKLELLRRSKKQVLNGDSEVLKSFADEFPDVYYFSTTKVVDRGAYVKDGKIYLNKEGFESEYICDLDDIHLLGEHNVQNVLAAVLIARLFHIPAVVVRRAVQMFRAVEHRIEFVKEIKGVRFYNDSKGTNPDSTIKAIEAMEAPIHLIAGGYEKNSDFREMFEIGRGKIKSVSLLGVTAPRMKALLEEMNLTTDITINDCMEDAVRSAYGFAKEGEVVLLSPASASWGMYANFEERGRHFKQCVMDIEIRK